MKILIDIGHPAHVHFFRNFIKLMISRGHKIIVIARNKDISFKLLDAYKIDYIDFGKHYKSLITKMIGGVLLVFKLYLFGKKERINIFLDSGGTVYPAVAAYLLRKPVLSFNNTDVFFMLKISKFFTSVFVTPVSYKLDFGKKHIRCKSFNELAFLHPRYFKPNKNVLLKLDLNEGDPYVLLRFVKWEAAEEIGYSGYSVDDIREVVLKAKKFGKVLISCEFELPTDLAKLQIEKNKKIIYGEMQDIEYYATLFLGESGAMASECAILGTPAIFVSVKELGFTEELDNQYNLIHYFKSKSKALEKMLYMLKMKELKKSWKIKQQKMISDKIDITAFMIWFVENYPESVKIMKENPDYQNMFK